MPRRLPQWLSTVPLLVGLVGAAVGYYAIGTTLRSEQACIAADGGVVGTLAEQCVADALFWREIATWSFIISLGIAFLGVLVDRLQRWRRWI